VVVELEDERDVVVEELVLDVVVVPNVDCDV